MLAKRKLRIILVILTVAIFLMPLSAQIMVEKDYHGQRVSCMYSGLIGVAKGCGTEGYARVFTGTVLSSVEKNYREKVLEILPDELFVGDSSEAIATADEACFDPEITAGDKWLFYLIRDPRDGQLLVSYQSSTKPIAEAEDYISMLRRLGHLTDKGILIGAIHRLGDDDITPTPLASHKIVAKNVKNGDEYSAYTSERGFFKFELPTGTYDVTPAPEYDLVEIDIPMLKGRIPIEKRQCQQHNLLVKPASGVVPPSNPKPQAVSNR